jgi:hypothetical protein
MSMVGGALERECNRGGTCGRTLLHHSERRMERQKNSKIKYIVALDGHQRINHTHQSTENMRVQQRRDRRGGSTGMEHGGGCNLIILGAIEF